MCTYSRNTSRTKQNCVSHGNFDLVTGLEEQIELIVVRINLYTQQKGKKFMIDNDEVKAFLDINYIMAINKLPTITENWKVDNLIGNNIIQNTMI